VKTPAKHSGDDVFTRNLILEITLNNNKQIIQLMTMRAHVLLTPPLDRTSHVATLALEVAQHLPAKVVHSLAQKGLSKHVG
jgi:hypothetical protein